MPPLHAPPSVQLCYPASSAHLSLCIRGSIKPLEGEASPTGSNYSCMSSYFLELLESKAKGMGGAE